MKIFAKMFLFCFKSKKTMFSVEDTEDLFFFWAGGLVGRREELQLMFPPTESHLNDISFCFT